MVTHSSILAWRIPWTGETGGLQSIGSLDRVRHDRARTFIIRKIHIRYKQQINQSTSEKLFFFSFLVCFFLIAPTRHIFSANAGNSVA